MSNRILMGLDIGQHRDPTALCVVEVDQRKKRMRTAWHFLVRYLERLLIGTTYPAIAQRLDEIARGIRQKGAHTPQRELAQKISTLLLNELLPRPQLGEWDEAGCWQPRALEGL